MDLAHVITENLNFQMWESMVLQLIWSLLREAREHFLMISIIFTLMYGLAHVIKEKLHFQILESVVSQLI